MLSPFPSSLLFLCLTVCTLSSSVLSVQLNQTYAADSGVIYSPNYPADYDNNLRYFMTISVEPGYYIYLTLLDFETEPCCDKLYIWDGLDVRHQTIANVSGTKTGSSYTSLSSTMTLMFSTDPLDTARGFAIKWEQIPDNQKVEATNQCDPTIQSSSVGFVTSPNWPSDYPNNISCSYKLSSTKSRVMLQFVAFTTEGCCDKVFIYDGVDSNAKPIATLSGSSLSNSTFYSSGPNMFLLFSTDITTNDVGFSALYVSV